MANKDKGRETASFLFATRAFRREAILIGQDARTVLPEPDRRIDSMRDSPLKPLTGSSKI